MGAVLVTGCSGSGKTSVAAELTRRGLDAVDADNVLAAWLDRTGKPVWLPDDADPAWFSEHTWSWDLELLDELVDGPGIRYVCGNADNVALAWPRFDRAYLLVIDETTMVTRLDNPGRDHDFGRASGQRTWLRNWCPQYQQQVTALGAIPVDARQPLSAVVDAITGAAEQARQWPDRR
ncbi:nucleoside kinase [Actinokineospora diospyrosa]